MKETKVWSLKKADTSFSIYIREKYGVCERCETPDGLTCSHYFPRYCFGTRFDPLNCISLCMKCHADWENKKETEYKKFMIDWLGKEEFATLEKRAHAHKKRSTAIEEWKKFYEKFVA